MKILNSRSLEDWEKFRAVIIPEQTKVIYSLSLGDNVVNVAQALPKWKEFFARLGVPFEFVEMKGAKHADTSEAMKHYEEWLDTVHSIENVVFSRSAQVA
jgi:hypothetical protein